MVVGLGAAWREGKGRGGSCTGHCALMRSSVEGGEAGEGWRGVGAVGQVGSRRRRREVGDGPDAWGRSVSERREGEGEAGRRWLLGQKSELGSRPALVGGEK
jgi:hypothetical protein